jgi:hypothetical protein
MDLKKMLDDLAATAGGVVNTLGIDPYIDASGNSELMDNIRATASGASEALDDGSLIYNSIDKARGLGGPAGMVADMLLPSRPTPTKDQEGGAVEPDSWGQDLISGAGIGIPALLDKAAAATLKRGTSKALDKLAEKMPDTWADDLEAGMQRVYDAAKASEGKVPYNVRQSVLDTVERRHYTPRTVSGRFDDKDVLGRLGWGEVPEGKISKDAFDRVYLEDLKSHEELRNASRRAFEMKHGSVDTPVEELVRRAAEERQLDAIVESADTVNGDWFGSFNPTPRTHDKPLILIADRAKGESQKFDRMGKISTGMHELRHAEDWKADPTRYRKEVNDPRTHSFDTGPSHETGSLETDFVRESSRRIVDEWNRKASAATPRVHTDNIGRQLVYEDMLKAIEDRARKQLAK